MITKLSIQHYRSIQALELSPGNISVFVGTNSAGKSNIIDAIKFVRDAIRNGLDQAITERHGLNSIRQWAPTRPYNITITIELTGPRRPQTDHGSFSFTLGSKGDEYVILREEGSWRDSRRIRRRDGEEGFHTVHRHAAYSRDKLGFVTLHSSRSQEGFDGPSRIEVDNPDDFFLNSRFSFEFATLTDRLVDFQDLHDFSKHAESTPKGQ